MSKLCCFICRRYQPAEKMTAHRCTNRVACYRVFATRAVQSKAVARRAKKLYGSTQR